MIIVYSIAIAIVVISYIVFCKIIVREFNRELNGLPEQQVDSNEDIELFFEATKE